MCNIRIELCVLLSISFQWFHGFTTITPILLLTPNRNPTEWPQLPVIIGTRTYMQFRFLNMVDQYDIIIIIM